ncbi:hypothetical protein PtB15_15B221 [Puccinia triticina]|nr:hypothetical protein PtB15_15B221 [Puccinia triticina]
MANHPRSLSANPAMLLLSHSAAAADPADKGNNNTPTLAHMPALPSTLSTDDQLLPWPDATRVSFSRFPFDSISGNSHVTIYSQHPKNRTYKSIRYSITGYARLHIPSTTMTALTDYERQRLENIKKNQSLLSSLAIKSVGPAAKKGLKKPAPTSTPATKKRARPAAGTTDSPVPLKRHATRASVRLGGAGLTPAELQSRLDKQEEELASERQKREELKHADRPLVAEHLRTGPSVSLTSTLFSSLASTLSQKTKTMKQEEVNLDYSPGTDADYDRLADALNGLQLRALNKVCPNRIYSMTFHPDRRKSLLFMGEKLGGVGIWDALGADVVVKSEDVEDEDHVSTSSTNTADASSKPSLSPAKPVKEEEESAEDDEEDRLEYVEGRPYFIQAHARNSAVSAIQTHPSDPHLIYTSSYDGTIRELNFETRQSTEIVDGPMLSDDDILFSAFEFANHGRELWASDTAGGLVHRDTRQPKTAARRWTASKKKIGCLSICPGSGDRLAVTAGLNREMRLWDLRALSGLPPTSEIGEVESGSCLASYAHGLACSSAYFSPAGDRILSTSYDDLVRVWEIKPETRDAWLSSHPPDLDLAPAYQARHDNQTGRWVSVMKARWCPNLRFPSHFTVGNMAHKLDVYSPKGELLAQLKHPALTTVPAVTAQHPTSSNLQVAGATAGGKVYLWT